MKPLILAAALAALPFAAHADEWAKLRGDIVAGTAPECAKPIAQLSPIEIDHCVDLQRKVREAMAHFLAVTNATPGLVRPAGH